MPSDPAPSPGEYRPYRRFVSLFILSFVSLGSAWLLASVGVTIYRRRHAVPVGELVGAIASAADLVGCHEELADVEQGLERHLENSPHVVAHYEQTEVQRWDEDTAFWLGQWKAAEERCHFGVHRPGRHSKEWEELATIHAELHETEASYTKELKRFGKNEAPRLDRIRDRLARVGARLDQGPAAGAGTDVVGESPHQPGSQPGSKESGETTP